MREIELTQNKVAIVDDEDYDYLSQWKWYAKLDTGTGKFYAARTDRSGTQKTVRMHRVIMKTPDDMETDHINLDTLYNIKENLRNVSRSQNMMNRNYQKNSTTKAKGVRARYNGRFWAGIKKDGVNIYIGSYLSLEEASNAYDEKAKELFGEFGRLNDANAT